MLLTFINKTCNKFTFLEVLKFLKVKYLLNISLN